MSVRVLFSVRQGGGFGFQPLFIYLLEALSVAISQKPKLKEPSDKSVFQDRPAKLQKRSNLQITFENITYNRIRLFKQP